MVGNGRVNAGEGAMATLLFAPGTRPDADALVHLGQTSNAFAVSHRPTGTPGWVELLRDGLTFDISGLAPDDARPGAGAPLRMGLAAAFDAGAHEALVLAPGPHLAGAQNLLPVVQVAVRLLVAMADLPGVAAIGWVPAENLVSPSWFVNAVMPWLDGGPFPALALAGLKRRTDRVASSGLAFFIGQEFELHTSGGRPAEAEARAAVRLLDWLVAHGRVDTAQAVTLPGVGTLWLEAEDRDNISIRWA